MTKTVNIDTFSSFDMCSTSSIRIYWNSGDGLIQPHELKAVLAACSAENGMKFSEEQLDQLTEALYEDAAADGTDQQDMGIGFDELKAQMAKQPGLLDNLSIR